MIPLFDTHAHLDLESFADDLDAVLRRVESGTFPDGLAPKELDDKPIELIGVLLPGIDGASSWRCVELAKRSTKFHAAAAIHPNYVALATADDWKTIAELVQCKEVVAVGETGLDRYWDHSPIEQQIDALWQHIEWAKQTAKPIQIHCRDAWDDMLPILRQAALDKKLTGIIHAFSGEPEQALECVELGFYISFAGSLTYRNAKFSPLWEAAKVVLADRLLVETDSPYMPPYPFRGKLQRNEPVLTAMVVLRLAELRGEPLEFVAETTTKNAQTVLNL